MAEPMLPADPPAFDRLLDATGLRCPLPALRARKQLLSMRAGEVLLLIADDPMAEIDIPHFCTGAGHSLGDVTRVAGNFQFRIKKGI